MGRLTITLSDEQQRALRETAARTGKSIRQLIEESLQAYGVKSTTTAADLVARARAHARLPPDEAVDLAIRQTRDHRAGR
ncbi:ribbon-helix-helix protein, CopG family [Spiribacter halobius]|uniref:CopG family transcriptional regulator n=1 Tax=Sediminicurvatus halobius TaxID=2182432 RepID=A0A2U2N3P3_9GAMM|nr:CopG family transcriptional regulator [Spiribacter halobius]